MSRGPGRWQRLLLHELYHTEPQPNRWSGRPQIYVGDYATTRCEVSAVYRAARAIKAKGWAISPRPGPCNYLTRCDPAPAAADRDRCPMCKWPSLYVPKDKCSQGVANDAPDNIYATHVMGLDGKLYPRTNVAKLTTLRFAPEFAPEFAPP